jgi:hypothetical protein
MEVAAIVKSGAVPEGLFKDWLTKFHQVVMARNPTPAKYQQTRIANGVTLYSAGGAPEQKVLLVGLCSRAQNLCAPTAMVLQYFPDDAYDLVVLRDIQLKGFSLGILGYAQPMQAVVTRLRSDIDIGRYRETRTFGVSSGGAAALLVGSLLEATRAVCIGGKMLTASDEYGKAQSTAEFENALRNSGLNPSRALAVFAAGNRVDGVNARQLARAFNVGLASIPGEKEHAFLESLDRAGRLADFFRTVGLLD